MLTLNPSKRLSLEEVLSHPFITNKPIDSLLLTPKIQRSDVTNSFEKPESDLIIAVSTKNESLNHRKKTAKDMIKRNLIQKITQLNTLDLSKVAETDGENSIDFSPTKYVLPKLDKQRSRFNKQVQKLSETTQSANMDLGNKLQGYRRGVSPSFDQMYKPDQVLVNQKEGKLSKSSTLKKYSSYQNLHKPTTQFGAEVTKVDGSPQITMSKGSNMKSVSGVEGSDSGTHIDSSMDELDMLRAQVDKRTTSNPVSLKDIPLIHNRYDSRGSMSIARVSEVGKGVDKYFTDLNGKSLLSTLNSSKDIFSNISAKRSASRSSLITGNRSNRGINAARNIMFGSNMQSLPSLPVNSYESRVGYTNDESPIGKGLLYEFK